MRDMLTHGKTEPVPNTIYQRNSLGLWFDPNGVSNAAPNRGQFYGQDPTPYRQIIDWLEGRLKMGATASVADADENPYIHKHVLDKKWIFAPTDTEVDLYTSIHHFQKFTVEGAKTWLKELPVRVGGHVFIRLPDNQTEGIERDFKPRTMSATPCVWNLTSFLELLRQVDRFRIVHTETFKPGQRDIILVRQEKSPKICAGLIVKNEERDLPACLNTMKDVVDGIYILDTGSTDNTIAVAKDLTPCPFTTYVETYVGASEKDETGDYKLWNFGKARNEYCSRIEELKQYDWILWMDADDEIRNPEMLRSLAYMESSDYHGICMVSSGHRWIHHRLWKTGIGVRYQGACHEYPIFTNKMYGTNHYECEIFHNGEPGVGESSNKRNLRILLREVAEEPTSRNTFYLANTHKDGGRYKEAVAVYKQRLSFGRAYADEYWFAALYMVRCMRLAGKPKKALSEIHGFLRERPDWAEFYMEAAHCHYGVNEYKKALGFCLLVQDMPIIPTPLFREHNQYTDQPYRLASWCYEHLGEIANALQHAKAVRTHLKEPDASWEARITRLEGLVGKKA